MNLVMTRWMQAMVTAAAVLAACAGPQMAMAQVRGVSDVKTLLVPTLPANALEVAAAVKAAKPGETITLRGNVALSKDAFGEQEATFTLLDEAARDGPRPAADALPDTSVAVPASARATIRVADAGGKTLRGSLRGKHGLKPGQEVFVTGVVDSANGTDTLVVTVASMHVPRASFPVGLFVERASEEARDVSEVRKAGGLKAGDRVSLRGRVGGSKEPFVAGRAVFTLVGRGLKACNEIPGDQCSAPWDYCCDTAAEINANSVTVQVVDAKGAPLRTDLKRRRGLKELSEVVVTGTVAVAGEKGVVVTAATMHVIP
jgi:hypothetical protein